MKIRSIHVGDLFGSRFVGSFIICEYTNKVDKLYNSVPNRLFVPAVHQLVHFALKSPTMKLEKGDSKAMLVQIRSNPYKKNSISSTV